MFWFFGREARGILAPQPGIEPTPSALEGEVLTTGPPGKSLLFFLHWGELCLEKREGSLGKVSKVFCYPKTTMLITNTNEHRRKEELLFTN